jgi:hypothetical protein
MFEQVAKEQSQYFSNEQGTILAQYPDKITWYQGDRRDKIIRRSCGAHLKLLNL